MSEDRRRFGRSLLLLSLICSERPLGFFAKALSPLELVMDTRSAGIEPVVRKLKLPRFWPAVLAS